MSRTKKIFSDSQLIDIISSYKNGELTPSLAKRLNTSREVISRTLKEAGIPVSNKKQTHLYIIQDIVISYKNGESARSIADRYGWDKGRVERTLKREKVPIRIFRVR